MVWSLILCSTPFDSAQGDRHPEWSTNFIKHNVQMKESTSNAVISIRQLAEGEISSNKQISPIVEMTRNGNLLLVAESKGVCIQHLMKTWPN